MLWKEGERVSFKYIKFGGIVSGSILWASVNSTNKTKTYIVVSSFIAILHTCNPYLIIQCSNWPFYPAMTLDFTHIFFIHEVQLVSVTSLNKIKGSEELLLMFSWFQSVSVTSMAVAVDSAKWLIRDVLQTLRRVEEALSLVGFIYLGKISVSAACDLLTGVRTHVWPKLFRRNLMKEFGTWAGRCTLRQRTSSKKEQYYRCLGLII